MASSEDLLQTFDGLWRQFSSTSRKVRANPSAKLIHHLRVTARRSIAVLEMISQFSENPAIDSVRRRFKKVLKWTSPLRDAHVQLQRVSQIHKTDLRTFERALQRRERQETRSVQKHLKRLGTQRLAQKIKTIRSELTHADKTLDSQKLHRSIERTLRLRNVTFQQTRAKFRASDEDTLHAMRIALKKLRYAAEAAQPILGDSVVRHSQKMKSFQRLIGDSRDTAIVIAELEQWAARKGKQKRIAAAVDRLRRHRESLITRISKSLPAFDKTQVLPQKRGQPFVEKVLAVGTAASVKPATVISDPSPKAMAR